MENLNDFKIMLTAGIAAVMGLLGWQGLRSWRGYAGRKDARTGHEGSAWSAFSAEFFPNKISNNVHYTEYTRYRLVNQ